MSDQPIRVLFVSTSNASRSILAEALLRRVGGPAFEASSAGIEPTAVHPLTRVVLERAGVDHDWATPKHVDEFVGQPFDYVVTLCDDARLVCPIFPGADQSMHWAIRSRRRSKATTPFASLRSSGSSLRWASGSASSC